MALDSIRLLTDSAKYLWQRLGNYGALEALPTSRGFDDWVRSESGLDSLSQIEVLQLKRDYHRLHGLLIQIEALVHSRSRVVELVRDDRSAMEQERDHLR